MQTYNELSFGNQQNIRYFSEAFRRGKLSHAYIIEGTAKSGKEELADMLAAALLCEKTVPGKGLFPDSPCRKCPSCVKAFSGNHPDIIHVRHAKTTVLSVGEIREQVVADMYIKPYYGPFKIYIIKDAQLMNVNAQNAILKTIEEPPEYGLLLLLTDNSDGFLETIRSRCIIMRMGNMSREKTAEDLLDEDGLMVISVLEKMPDMDAFELDRYARDLENLDRQQILDIMRLWSRDLLVKKSTGSETGLYFAGKEKLLDAAGRMEFENINRVIAAVDNAEARLKANVKAEAVFENLLLAVRKEYIR